MLKIEASLFGLVRRKKPSAVFFWLQPASEIPDSGIVPFEGDLEVHSMPALTVGVTSSVRGEIDCARREIRFRGVTWDIDFHGHFSEDFSHIVGEVTKDGEFAAQKVDFEKYEDDNS